MAFAMVALLSVLAPTVYSLTGDGVRLTAHLQGNEWVETIEARDAKKAWRTIAVSPSHKLSKSLVAPSRIAAISEGSIGKFVSPPTSQFSAASKVGEKIQLIVRIGSHLITKTVSLTQDRKRFLVSVRDVAGADARLSSLWSLYSFVPDKLPLSIYKRPDSTYTPQLRQFQDNVIGDHIFRNSFVTAQRGGLALSIIPELDLLEQSRGMQTALELDCKNGVVDAPLLGYGLCSYDTTAHVRYSVVTRAAHLSAPIEFRYFIEATANAPAYGAYQSPTQFLWKQYGHSRFVKVYPQVMTWNQYANVCIPAVMSEAYGTNKLGWFEHEIDGVMCGGIPAGWGYTNGIVSWQCWFNNLRSAWGVRWFGQRTGTQEWIDRGNKMLNLALAAPRDKGAFPTTYDGRKKAWLPCLIRPDPTCYYDLPSMAWKGIWLIEWLPFGHRVDDIKAQCKELADFFVSIQNTDGSYPSWLARDMKIIPQLRYSAQSALPAWFLARWHQISGDKKYLDSATRCADFLMKEIIPQQKYYDFETFFSCSPKELVASDDAMRDMHTMSPPQNTLCMQWAAEALRVLFVTTRDERYKTYGRMALDIMNTYQTVFAPKWITSAYVFGGYGVQNSDGEHLDARQAQFGVTNFEWGVMLQDQELCERGVAATRAAMTLINHPLHDRWLVYPQPNYPLGLQPENVAHGGTDHQAGRTGFDWGEGSGLTSAAWLLGNFGGFYISKDKGWAVGVEAVYPVRSGSSWVPVTPLNRWGSVLAGFQISTTGGGAKAELEEGIRILKVEVWDDWQIAVAAEFDVNGPRAIQATDGTGKVLGTTAVGSKTGGRMALVYMIPNTGPVTFSVMDGEKAAPGTVTISRDPNWSFEGGLQGWDYAGNLPAARSRSTRFDFNKQGNWFIGTCEDGFGGFNDSLTAVLTSPVFYSSKPKLHFRVGGGNGERTYVALVDANTGEELLRARGENKEAMRDASFDLAPFKGRLLRVRIVDRATGGWGHINADGFRVGD